MQNPSYFITKYWTPYVLKLNAHLLWNMEPLLPLLRNMEQLICQDPTPIHYETWNPSCPYYSIWNTLCAKIPHPFITKHGTPLAPVTIYGTPYVPRSHTHSLQNMEPLLPLLLNMEHLMCQDHTPIHYEIWNPLWHHRKMSKTLMSWLFITK